MKKLFSTVVAAIGIFMFGGQALAELPSSGDFVVEGNGGEFSVSCANGKMLVNAPVIPSQLKEQGLTNPNWQLYSSISYNDGKKWTLIPQDNDEKYALKTSESDGMLIGEIIPPEKGSNEWVWLRTWGRDMDQQPTENTGWLWINQSDKHARNDKNGKPGYESLVNKTTCEVRTVPKDYKVRH